ncbi:hypothetical protein [Ruegeria sp. SCP11]|uniref:hypothetical protein n=1 Tax=Ruegeria sp. SCP11 TaxID=3141378 RepID=UPI003335714D
MTMDEHKLRLNMLHRMLKLIPTRYRALEAEVMPTKWPEYRFLTPMDATKQFHRAYIEAYKNYYRENIDVIAASDIKIGFKLSYFKRSSDLTQLNNARLKADRIGLPYPAYLEFAFKFAAARKRKFPPQPNQLWPTEKAYDAWLTKIVEFWSDDRHGLELNRMKVMPQYAYFSYQGLPAQRQFRKEMLDLVSRGVYSIDGFVAKHVVERQYFRAVDCHFLGEKAVECAERKAREDVANGFLRTVELKTPTSKKFYQSCFGVPGVVTSDNPICSTCTQRGDCELARQTVISKTLSETGFADPIAEADRRANRRRVNACRTRQSASRLETNAAPKVEVAV